MVVLVLMAHQLSLAVLILVLGVSGFSKMSEESSSLKDKSQEQVERKILPKPAQDPEWGRLRMTGIVGFENSRVEDRLQVEKLRRMGKSHDRPELVPAGSSQHESMSGHALACTKKSQVVVV